MHDVYRGAPHVHHPPSFAWQSLAAKPFTIGVGGPVGSGKTALVDCLCKALRGTYRLAVVTNDIYTKEDAEFSGEALSRPATSLRRKWWR